MTDWKLKDTFLNIATNWVRLIGERYTDQDNKDIEYYRVEKTDSVIVLPVYKDLIYCAPPSFRPGVQRSTLDFPGGRSIENKSIQDSALAILERELGVSADSIILRDSLFLNMKSLGVGRKFFLTLYLLSIVQ